MTWLWWAIPLILVVFLWTLNEFLRGRLKEVTSGVFAILILALVAIAFAVSGWKFGIGALVGAFVLASLLRPAALMVARRLIPYPDLGFEHYRRRQLARTKEDFESDGHFERREKEEQEEARHKSETVSTAMKIPAVAEVLARLNAAEQDLAAFYDRIEVHSLPPRARKTVLHNARLVAFFLENSEPYEVFDGTYARKVSMDTAIRLQLWTHSNPGGEEPNPR
ncbi:MAG: hypothetical protein ABFD90_14690 [Phycisphaerales bacterium]